MFKHIVSKSHKVDRVRIKRYISGVSNVFLLKSIKFLRKTILSPTKERGKAHSDVFIFCIVLIGRFVRKSVIKNN